MVMVVPRVGWEGVGCGDSDRACTSGVGALSVAEFIEGRLSVFLTSFCWIRKELLGRLVLLLLFRKLGLRLLGFTLGLGLGLGLGFELGSLFGVLGLLLAPGPFAALKELPVFLLF